MKVTVVLILIVIMISTVSAGVGIKWENVDVKINSEQENCLTYGVYNPWPEESLVEIKTSKNIEKFVAEDVENIEIREYTGSQNSIPFDICFSLEEGEREIACNGNRYINGELLVNELPNKDDEIVSDVVSTVSAPLLIEIDCSKKKSDSRSIVFFILSIFFATVAFTTSRRLKRNK